MNKIKRSRVATASSQYENVLVLCFLNKAKEVLWIQPAQGKKSQSYDRLYYKKIMGKSGQAKLQAFSEQLKEGYLQLFEMRQDYWEYLQKQQNVQDGLKGLIDQKSDKGYLKYMHALTWRKYLGEGTCYVLCGNKKTGYWLASYWSKALSAQEQVDNLIKIDPDFGHAILWNSTGACTLLDEHDVHPRIIEERGLLWVQSVCGNLMNALEGGLQRHYEVRVDWRWEPSDTQNYALFDWSSFYAKSCVFGYLMNALSYKRVLISRNYEEWLQNKSAKACQAVAHPGGWFVRSRESVNAKHYTHKENDLGALSEQESAFLLQMLAAKEAGSECAWLTPHLKDCSYWSDAIGCSATPRLHFISGFCAPATIRLALEHLWEQSLVQKDIFGIDFLDLLLLHEHWGALEAWLDVALLHKKQARSYLKSHVFESAADFEQRVMIGLLFEVQGSSYEQKVRILQKVRTLVGGAYRSKLMSNILKEVAEHKSSNAQWVSLWEHIGLERCVKRTPQKIGAGVQRL